MARKLRTHDACCKHCGKKWTVTNRQISPPNFCGQRCSNLWQYSNGRLAASSREARIQKFGLDAVLLQESGLFDTFQCEECGKVVTKRKRKPTLRFCNRTCSSRFTAKNGRKPNHSSFNRSLMAQRMIKRLLDQPDNVYSWSTIKGWYKGIYFRSSYEYHFLKWLEKNTSIQEISLNEFRIPYFDGGQEHVYVPDFYVKIEKKVYEVKSSYALKYDSKVKLKVDAAIEYLKRLGIEYQLVTENDFFIPKNNSRFLISQDPCVFLSTPTNSNDSWDQLFVEQTKFMKLLQQERDFPSFPVDLTTKQGQRLIKEVSYDCMHELFEAIHLLKNSKSHRRTEMSSFDREAFTEELADVLHYLIEICILAGLSPREMYQSFMKKGTINFARINGGY